jgi:Ala-tRNA(Pro) deacylase
MSGLLKFLPDNDIKHEHLVELVIDQSLWQSDAFQFHPLVNTATCVISRRNLKRFIAMIGHEPTIVGVPAGAEGR